MDEKAQNVKDNMKAAYDKAKASAETHAAELRAHEAATRAKLEHATETHDQSDATS